MYRRVILSNSQFKKKNEKTRVNKNNLFLPLKNETTTISSGVRQRRPVWFRCFRGPPSGTHFLAQVLHTRARTHSRSHRSSMLFFLLHFSLPACVFLLFVLLLFLFVWIVSQIGFHCEKCSFMGWFALFALQNFLFAVKNVFLQRLLDLFYSFFSVCFSKTNLRLHKIRFSPHARSDETH